MNLTEHTVGVITSILDGWVNCEGYSMAPEDSEALARAILDALMEEYRRHCLD